MVEINKHGFIVGGLCDKRLRARSGRREGAEIAWLDAQVRGCVQFRKRGWMRMKKNLDSPPYNRFPTAAQEISYLRMTQEVFPTLIKSKRCFRELTMQKWIYDEASFEFTFFGTPLDPKSMAIGLGPPHHPDLYEKIHGKKP